MPSDMYLCAGTTNGMIGMFLGPGSGYHGHRKRQDSRQAHHDDDLPNHLPHVPHASKNIEVVCSSTKRHWLIRSVVQVMGRLQVVGLSRLSATHPRFYRQVV